MDNCLKTKTNKVFICVLELLLFFEEMISSDSLSNLIQKTTSIY